MFMAFVLLVVFYQVFRMFVAAWCLKKKSAGIAGKGYRYSKIGGGCRM